MPADHQSRPTVTTTQLMSSALAAVTAAVVGSRLGIAGTLVGAAAGSVIATAGTAMYGHWLDRTASRVRTVVRVPVSRNGRAYATSVPDTVDDTEVDETQPAPTNGTVAAEPARRQPTWRLVGLAAAAACAIAIGSITAFEAFLGEPVSTLTGGDIGSGTTLGRAVDGPPTTLVPEPDPAPSTPDPTPTPTPTDPAVSPTTPPTTGEPTTPPTTPPPSDEPTTPPTTPNPPPT